MSEDGIADHGADFLSVSIVSIKVAVALNALIISAYVAISILIESPWLVLAAFLLFAVLIRISTTVWCWKKNKSNNDEGSFIWHYIVIQAFLGLLFSGAAVGTIWGIGRIWVPARMAGPLIVSILEVGIAYKSLFPLNTKRRRRKEMMRLVKEHARSVRETDRYLEQWAEDFVKEDNSESI